MATAKKTKRQFTTAKTPQGAIIGLNADSIEAFSIESGDVVVCLESGRALRVALESLGLKADADGLAAAVADKLGFECKAACESSK